MEAYERDAGAGRSSGGEPRVDWFEVYTQLSSMLERRIGETERLVRRIASVGRRRDVLGELDVLLEERQAVRDRLAYMRGQRSRLQGSG